MGVAALLSCGGASEPQVHTQLGNTGLCIVTAFTENQANFGRVAAANHARYAARHGYTSRSYNGRISGELFVNPARGGRDTLHGGGLYWQKLVAVRNMLQHQDVGEAGCAWAMWVDADVIFTNPDRKLEALIQQAGGTLAPTPDGSPAADGAQVILSAEQIGGPWLNAGVFLVKNSPQGRSFIDAVVDSYPEYKDRPWPEQDAMSDLVAPEIRQAGAPRRFAAVLLPQRLMNSFDHPKFGHMTEAAWQPGDFIAHLVNSSAERRLTRMRELLPEL